MSDAMYGFATGFAQGFSSTYTARLEAEAAEKRDKIRFGAQAWMEQEKRYNSAKAADQALMDQAEALVSSESLIPKDAVIDVFNMLKSGRSEANIRNDVRTAGAKFELLPKPTDGSELVVPENDQTEDMLGGEDTSLSTSAMNTGDKVVNPNEVASTDTSSAPKKDDPNNPFTQYNTDIREAVGQGEGDYFDQVISGYSSPTRKSKYKFVPGLTKTNIPSLNELIGQNVLATDEYKNGTPEERLQLLYEASSPSKQSETIAEQFRSKLGTGAEAASMFVWSLTDEGKAALESKDPVRISTAWTTFHNIVDPDDKSEFDPDDIEGSVYSQWLKTPEGIKATTADGEGNVDDEAIASAMANASDIATRIRTATNGSYGFNIKNYKTLADVANARVEFEGNTAVNSQLDNLEENLLTAKREEKLATEMGKDFSVFGIDTEGNSSYIGIGNRRGGQLYMMNPQTGKEEVVDPQDANRYALGSVDFPIDAEKINASGWAKARKTLNGSVTFASSALSYLAKLEKTPTGKTYVARGAARVGEFLNELDALGQLVQDADGLISRDKLEEQLKTNASFSKYSEQVMIIKAQEALLVFELAKADGNSGHALSNQDYTNYYNSLFISNTLEATKALLEEKVAQMFASSVKEAEAVGDGAGMQYVLTNGNGSAWWKDPRTTALEGARPEVINFIKAGEERISSLYEGSSYAQTVEQKRDAYIAGEEILVDQAFVDANPGFKGFLGQRIQSKLEDRN